MRADDRIQKKRTAEDLIRRLGVATGLIKVYGVACSASRQRAGHGWPIMDETKPTSAAGSTNRDRLAGIIWSATRAMAPLLAMLMAGCLLMMALPLIDSIIRGEVREILALTLVLALGFLVMFAFLVVPHVLVEWFSFYEWASRRRSELQWKKIEALGDAHKAPFQHEQRCKPSPAEEVWVRRVRRTESDKLLLEVLHTRDGGQMWKPLPLRLSPWARFKCIMHEEKWPPASGVRNLSCGEDGIAFEVIPVMAFSRSLRRSANSMLSCRKGPQ